LCFVANFLCYTILPNIFKIGQQQHRVIAKTKRVPVFLKHSVYLQLRHLQLLLHLQLQLHPTTRKAEGKGRAALRQGKERKK